MESSRKILWSDTEGRFSRMRFADDSRPDVSPVTVAAGDGVIVNVASIARFQPTPYMAIYGASEALLLSFSEARWAENQETGVRVLAHCPGPVETEFFKAFGGQEPAAMSRRDTTENTVRTPLRVLDRRRSHLLLASQSGRLVSRGRWLGPVRENSSTFRRKGDATKQI